MKIKPLLSLIIVLLLPLLAAGCAALDNTSSTAVDLDPILASGVIEADQTNIAPELSGRIKAVHAQEGDSVSAGDLLLSLEDDLLLAQKTQAVAQYNAAVAQRESAGTALEAARAALAAAEAGLDLAQVQRNQILAQAQASQGEDRVATWNETTPSQIDLPAWYFQQKEMVNAAKNILDLAWDEYQTELENYQQIVDDIGSEEFLEAEQRLADAQAAFQIADALRDRRVGYTGREEIEDQVDTIFDYAETELEAAQKAYDQILAEAQYEDILEARARVSVAREHYDLAGDYLAEQYTGPYSYDVQASEALLSQAEAVLRQARAQVDLAFNNEISASLAVDQAMAAVEIIDLQLAKLEISSPISGVVLSRSAEPGEVAGAGFPLMTVGELADLSVTVYLPEDRYGQVNLGDITQLSIDAYPDESFEAEVIYISDQAEYTPRNVQTQEERQNTVYAVKLSVKNTSGILKPGMPADVVFNP